MLTRENIVATSTNQDNVVAMGNLSDRIRQALCTNKKEYGGDANQEIYGHYGGANHGEYNINMVLYRKNMAPM